MRTKYHLSSQLKLKVQDLNLNKQRFQKADFPQQFVLLDLGILPYFENGNLDDPKS